MKRTTIWQLCVLTVILVSHSSNANVACPMELTKMSNHTVIHMCRDESANGLQGLYLDAFLPVNRRAVCNCSLRASVNLLVGMNSVVLPEKNCNSELFIKPIHRIAVYTCNSGGTSSSEQRTIEKEWRMYLTANPTDKNVTYCINLYIASGSGTLSIQCYPTKDSPPAHSAESSSTSAATAVSVTSTTTPGTTFSSGSTESKITDETVTMKSSMGKYSEEFPVAAVAGGVGGVALLSAVVVVLIIFIKRKRRNTKYDADTDVGYCNMDADPYKDQNTNSSGNEPGDPANYQHQNRAQKTLSVAGDYASIEDEPTSIAHRPHMAIGPNIPRTSGHDEREPELGQDQVSNMYAKVDKRKPGKSLTGVHLPAMHEPNKPSTSRHDELEPEVGQDQVSNMYAKVDKRKPGKTLTGVHLPAMHVNQLYSSVGEAEMSDQSLEVGPSGDVYAVVNKKKKSGGKSNDSNSAGKDPQPKGKDSESETNGSKSKDSETTGDIYTEVRKPKKHAKPSDS